MAAPIIAHWLADQDGWPQPIAKTASDTLSISLTESSSLSAISMLTEDFEDATFVFTVTSGNWVRTTTQAHAGTWSWTNDNIADNQTTDMVVQIPAGATSVQFWYKTDSELNFDYLRFLIDGVQQFQASGVAGAWTQSAKYDLTGKTSLTFRYFKDGSQDGGTDSVWVDDIVFEGSFGPPPVSKDGTNDPLNINLSTESSTLVKAGEQLLAPDAILTQTGLTGALTVIDEDPATPDGVWMTGSGANPTVLRVSFPTPSVNLAADFEQEFRIRLRPGT